VDQIRIVEDVATGKHRSVLPDPVGDRENACVFEFAEQSVHRVGRLVDVPRQRASLERRVASRDVGVGRHDGIEVSGEG
jgi:hypothetical protein